MRSRGGQAWRRAQRRDECTLLCMRKDACAQGSVRPAAPGRVGGNSAMAGRARSTAHRGASRRRRCSAPAERVVSPHGLEQRAIVIPAGEGGGRAGGRRQAGCARRRRRGVAALRRAPHMQARGMPVVAVPQNWGKSVRPPAAQAPGKAGQPPSSPVVVPKDGLERLGSLLCVVVRHGGEQMVRHVGVLQGWGGVVSGVGWGGGGGWGVGQERNGRRFWRRPPLRWAASAKRVCRGKGLPLLCCPPRRWLHSRSPAQAREPQLRHAPRRAAARHLSRAPWGGAAGGGGGAPRCGGAAC